MVEGNAPPITRGPAARSLRQDDARDVQAMRRRYSGQVVDPSSPSAKQSPPPHLAGGRITGWLHPRPRTLDTSALPTASIARAFQAAPPALLGSPIPPQALGRGPTPGPLVNPLARQSKPHEIAARNAASFLARQ
jgi:hypothetical protein